MDNKTCPKSLRYSARANIPPDEQFKKDIQAIKQKAEQGFLSALAKFNHRRLERQKNKLRKEKGKTPRKSTPERGLKNKSKPKPLSADISVKNLAAILGMDSENVSTLLSTLKEIVNNKDVEKYTCLFTECSNTTNTDSEKKSKGKTKMTKTQIKTRKRNERRKLLTSSLTKNNDRFIKNLSKTYLTDNEIKLLSKGLKFIPTAIVTKNKMRRRLLQDYNDFARRMRLKYIFHGQNKSIHPFYVKSNWEPPVQPSVTLETYLEEVKQQIAEIKITRPKPNLSRKERKALNVLKQNKDLNFKKADKGSTLVVMDKNDKIQEG